MDELLLVIVKSWKGKPWKWRNENWKRNQKSLKIRLRQNCDVDEKYEQSQKRVKKKMEDAISPKLLQDHVSIFFFFSVKEFDL